MGNRGGVSVNICKGLPKQIVTNVYRYPFISQARSVPLAQPQETSTQLRSDNKKSGTGTHGKMLVHSPNNLFLIVNFDICVQMETVFYGKSTIYESYYA